MRRHVHLPPPAPQQHGQVAWRVAASCGCACRYWNDPEVLKKLGSAMGDSMEGFPGMGAGGQMPPGWPGAVENGAAANAKDEGEAEGEAEEATVHSAASTGALCCHV